MSLNNTAVLHETIFLVRSSRSIVITVDRFRARITVAQAIGSYSCPQLHVEIFDICEFL